MAKFELNVNGQNRPIEADSEMSLLWDLRDLVQLTGTKYGCGTGMCSVLRMPEAPKLETWTVDSHDEPRRVGEAAVALTAPAVANAIFCGDGEEAQADAVRMDE